MTAVQVEEQALEEKLTLLEESRQWSPRVVSKLEMTIRTADDFGVFRINPLQYAAEHGIDEQEAVELFLYGSKVGLFEMEWDLVCASCAHVFKSFRRLEKLDPHFVCDLCSMENESSLDDYIHVTFTISPQVRDITFHRPDGLSAEDLYFKYHFSKDVKPFPGGLSIEYILHNWTKLVTYLEPGEKKEIELDLEPGALSVRDVLNTASIFYMIHPEGEPDADTLSMVLVDGQLEDDEHPRHPLTVEFPNGIMNYPQVAELASGKRVIEIENKMDQRASVWILKYPPGMELNLVQFEPFLSGKQLLSTQTFRNLFRAEVVSSAEGLAVEDLTYLFTDLKDSTAMYDEVGDPKAYNLVRLHFDTLGEVVASNSGAIVKTIGDAIMASFVNPVDAMKAALDMLHELAEFNRTITEDLILKIGLHKGHSIAVTLNDRIDYFGQSVNIAARVQQLAGAGEIYLTEDIYDSPGVSDLLEPHTVSHEEGIMKGVEEKIPVYRVQVSA